MTTTTKAPMTDRERAYAPRRAEQETTIRWDREDPMVHLWSASPVTWRKMERLGIAPTRESRSYGRLAGRWFRWGLKRTQVGAGAHLPRSPRLAVRLPL